MNKTISGAKPYFPLRLLVVNYIGGLGYYWLVVACGVWAIELFTHVRQYIIYEVVHVVPDTLTLNSASHLTNTTGDVSKIFAEVFSLIVVAACLLVIIVLPYYIGLYGSRFVDYLLYVTGRSRTLDHLLSLKQTFCLSLIGAFIVTTYDFSQGAQANSYSFGLIGAVAVVMILFWLQHVLAKWWHLQKQSVF